jgi:CheY-like chemotaxis protein
MENLASPPLFHAPEHPRVRLLLADENARIRSLLTACVLEFGEAIAVLEAEDGAEAVQLGLQQRPQIALLDINMPKLGGIGVALTLRELEPEMHVALQTRDPHAHSDLARAHHLPLFDKLEPQRALGWLDAQVKAWADDRPHARMQPKRTLECSSCGYGIACWAPPARCPMCQAEGPWIQTRRRRSRAEIESFV